MGQAKAEVIICGAGIAGISAAYHLAVRKGVKDVVLVDDRPPLTLTSDKSTECYRNWWPGPGDTMVRFMNRSIDLLEELADQCGNTFGLNRRGYVFLTADHDRVESFRQNAQAISALGAGPVRVHRPGKSTYQTPAAEGYDRSLTGADLLIGTELILSQFPFISDRTVAMLHPRRCGWLSAQQLGMYLLNKTREHGARLVEGKVVDVTVEKGKVNGVRVKSNGGVTEIQTPAFVNAAGPFVNDVASMVGVELPVFSELHGKISFNDTASVIPRDVPLMIWNDPVYLPWSEEERAALAADPETKWMLDLFPAGVHFRPEGKGGSNVLLVLWTYDIQAQQPVWPPKFDPAYPEIVLRGLSRMVPGLRVYFERMSRPYVDGGYYTKTQENRPLIGPLPVEGAFIIGALSGYGIMASQAAAELLAAHICGDALPDYAPDFLLSRYENPGYLELLAKWDATSGQL